MTIGKTSALTAGFLCAIAFGILIGPTVREWGSSLPHVPAFKAQPSESTVRQSAPAPRAAKSIKAAAVVASTPALQERLKPLLNKGANMAVAAEGFRSAEQFATVAHASRNTNVPFMVLKHRVVNERKSVASAIRESKPDTNGAVAANLARAQARSDIAAIAG
jgi:hypothetical protein